MKTPRGPRPLITVLGASGFIGSTVVVGLSRRPVRIRLVARRAWAPTATGGADRADIEIRTTDLREPGALAEAVAGSDSVIHLVAHTAGTGNWRAPEVDPHGRGLNEGLTHELVAAFRAERRPGPPPVVLFAGTAHPSGADADDGADVGSVHAGGTGGSYLLQKLAAERALYAATADGDLRGIVLRLPTVFGDSVHAGAADRGVVSTMVRRALAGEPLTMWHDGSVERDLLYVRDAAQAFVTALDHADRLTGRHWLVGSGSGGPLGDVLRTISELVAARTGKPPVPVTTVEPPGYADAADFQHVRIDSTPFRSATGWRPGVSLRDALDRTIGKEIA